MAVQQGGLQSLLLPHLWKGKCSRVPLSWVWGYLDPASNSFDHKNKTYIHCAKFNNPWNCYWREAGNVLTNAHLLSPLGAWHPQPLASARRAAAYKSSFQRPGSVGLVKTCIKKTFRLYVWLQYRELFPYESWFFYAYTVSGNPQRKVVRSNAR